MRAFNGMRAHIPVLLALAANSPFWQGRDTGLASARTPLFQAFPRTGIPREFATYADYAEAVDVLMRCGAIPGADVHLVGRAPAAALRHARGARDGRADAHPRHRRAGRAGPVPGADGGAGGHGRAASSSTRPRCSTRTASWPRATASTAQLLDPQRDRCVPASGAPGDAGRRLLAARAGARLRARAGGGAPLAGDPGAARQRARGGRRRLGARDRGAGGAVPRGSSG